MLLWWSIYKTVKAPNRILDFCLLIWEEMEQQIISYYHEHFNYNYISFKFKNRGGQEIQYLFCILTTIYRTLINTLDHKRLHIWKETQKIPARLKYFPLSYDWRLLLGSGKKFYLSKHL